MFGMDHTLNTRVEHILTHFVQQCLNPFDKGRIYYMLCIEIPGLILEISMNVFKSVTSNAKKMCVHLGYCIDICITENEFVLFIILGRSFYMSCTFSIDSHQSKTLSSPTVTIETPSCLSFTYWAPRWDSDLQLTLSLDVGSLVF